MRTLFQVKNKIFTQKKAQINNLTIILITEFEIVWLHLLNSF